MQLQHIPFYYPGLIQAATAAGGVGPPQNIMMTSAGSSMGPTTPGPSSLYYSGMYQGINRKNDFFPVLRQSLDLCIL